MASLPLSSDPGDAAESVVYRAASAGPQTHVLLLGVGSYPWSDLPELSSPAASARAMADWFLGFAETRFTNLACPLGSLAILLSEPAESKAEAKARAGAQATYRSLPTLRPGFEQARAAAEKWADRVAAHPGNMAVVYACGHGLSDQGRTAFILEDYGSDARRKFKGLIEADDFIKAAATLPAKAQMLFFDCCRNRVDTGVPAATLLGDRLIPLAGPRSPDIGQIALYATGLWKAAEGVFERPSLFAASLLNALDLAAVPRPGRYVVRSGALYDTISDCLALHGRSADDIQRPDGALSGARFDINFPTFSDTIRTFVSLADPAGWKDAEITITGTTKDGKTWTKSVKGDEAGEPFYEDRLRRSDCVAFRADIAGQTLLIEAAPVDAPAVWARFDPTLTARIAAVEVTRGMQSAVEVVRGMPSAHIRRPSGSRDDGSGIGGSAEMSVVAVDQSDLNVLVAGGRDVTEGATLDLEALHADAEPIHLVLPINQGLERSIPSGRYRIEVALPDGRKLLRSISLNPGDYGRINFEIGEPPREYLQAAFLSGTVRPRGLETVEVRQPESPPLAIDLIRPPTIARVDWEPIEGGDEVLSIREDEQSPPRYLVAGVADVPLRFQPYNASTPLWAAIDFGSRREVCFVPSIGSIGDTEGQSWGAEIVVDRSLVPPGCVSAAVVRSPPFTGLLGHLARRDFARAARVLAKLQTERLYLGRSPARLDIFGNGYNPLAKVAAGLILAATAPADESALDTALYRLAEEYPELPDGPVLVARRLWSRARTDDDRADVLTWFEQGLARGVPVFSLSVTWLAQGLGSLGGEPADVEAAAALARCVDARRCFTTLSLPHVPS